MLKVCVFIYFAKIKLAKRGRVIKDKKFKAKQFLDIKDKKIVGVLRQNGNLDINQERLIKVIRELAIKAHKKTEREI